MTIAMIRVVFCESFFYFKYAQVKALDSASAHKVIAAMSSMRLMVTQIAEHPGEVHFRISGLEAALERGLEPALGVGGARALAEEIGIATEVFGRRECDCIDPVLDRDMTRGGKSGYPMSQRSDEIAERFGG